MLICKSSHRRLGSLRYAFGQSFFNKNVTSSIPGLKTRLINKESQPQDGHSQDAAPECVNLFSVRSRSLRKELTEAFGCLAACRRVACKL
eukprot:4139063-Amphidinium_carterae.1